MKYIVFIFSIIISSTLFAQNVSNVAFYQDGKKIVITYSLDVPTNIILQYSTDGGKTFSAPLQNVSGHIGENVDAGNNTIVWNVLSEQENLIGNNIVFLVTAMRNNNMANNGTNEINPDYLIIPPLSKGIAHAGHYYVDLGLPSGTLWATYNIGASTPEEHGDYFAWGESKSKNFYGIDTYQWHKWASKLGRYMKYCINKECGKVDNKILLDLSDDAAYVNWGDKWRMPLPLETQELLKECKWIWTTINDTLGYQVIGPNNNSIFLPAAGYYFRSKLEDAQINGKYWDASLKTNTKIDMSEAHMIKFTNGSIKKTVSYGADSRYYGCSIRPVVNSVHISKDSKSLINIFSPVYGLDLWKVTTKDLQAKGYEVENKEYGSSTSNVKGLDFWDHNKDNIFEHIYMIRYDAMPTSWTQTVGLTWSLSYNQIISKFQELGFFIEITKSPKVKQDGNRNTLSAQIKAVSLDEKFSFTFDFDCGNKNGEGYSQDSPNSLYSISIKLIKN